MYKTYLTLGLCWIISCGYPQTKKSDAKILTKIETKINDKAIKVISKNEEKNNDTNEKVKLVLVGIFVTCVTQVLTIFITRKKEKHLKHEEQLSLLIGETKDLMRHCYINLKVLKLIDLKYGVPSSLHFKKMKIITDSSVLFSSDAFFSIKSDFTNHINRLRLNIRNINLEIDYILNLYEKNNIDFVSFNQYLAYLTEKMELSVEDTLPTRIASLRNKSSDYYIKLIRDQEKEKHEKDFEKMNQTIIYEKFKTPKRNILKSISDVLSL